MKVGGVYALAGRANKKVTVLETPAELRRKARVRVRFENGVKVGTIAELPSRRIARPWRDEPKKHCERPESQGSESPLEPVERAACNGDTVTLRGDETGLLWTVERIEAHLASLRTEIFDRPSTRQVNVDQLQVYEQSRRGQLVHLVSDQDSGAGAGVGVLDEKQWAAQHLSPQQPKRELERILDQLVFSQGCLRIYRRRLAPHLKGQAVSERLREEIRRKGYLLRGEELPGAEYARLRVRGRSDVVLDALPPPDEAVLVNWIHFPAKQKAKSGRQSRQRAA
jgi:hypothetical protein